MLVLVVLPLSNPTVPLFCGVFCVFSSVLCSCGLIIYVSWDFVVLSGIPVCPWVKDVVLGMSFKSLRSFSPSWSPGVGEDTLPPPDLHLVALILLGRRGEL